jgi:hypothetical protein
MSFFVAFVLAAFTGALYLDGSANMLSGVCSHTIDLCQHPMWPLTGAIAFGLGGLVFRANQL